MSIPFKRILVDYSERGIVDQNFYKINPRRQIPTVVFDDNRVLTETIAIMAYFADINPASCLAPKSGSFERANLDQWMSFILANIYEGELRKIYPQRYSIKAWLDVQERAETFVFENYQILENACSNDLFFFGETMTVVDIYIWMFINWLEDYEVMHRECPKLLALAERIMNRPKISPIHLFNFGPGLGWSAEQINLTSPSESL